MTIYFAIFALSVINSKIIRLKDNHNWLFYLLVLLPPVIFATIRYNIGTDYINYSYYYKSGNYLNTNNFEPLFRLLNYVSSIIFHDFYGVLLMSSLITYGFVLASLVRMRDELSISIGLWIFYCYYYVASLNVMRQLIAVSMVLYALIMLSNDHRFKYIFLITIASLFHTSAFIGLIPFILYGARKIKGDSWVYIIYYCSVFIVLLGGHISIFLAKLSGKYAIYFSEQISIVSGEYIIDILPSFIIIAIPIIVYIIFYRVDDKYDLLCITGLFSLVLMLMGYYFKWVTRAMYYFDIVQIPIWAINVKRIRLSENRIFIKAMVVFFYMFYFWYSSVYCGSNGGVPYQSLLF